MRILAPSGDDWLARVCCRLDGREWIRWIGVSAETPEPKAMMAVRTHINTPRRVASGWACEIIDIQMARMWEWRARQLIGGAPQHMQREVAGWQKGAA